MHGNARLTPVGRLTLVMRIESGRPVAHVAAEMGISRPTAYKWWRRWQDGGDAGLIDRSSRPHSCPHQTSPKIEAQIAELRRELKLGPVRLGARLGVAPSTAHRVLVRLGLNRLAWIDRPTGEVIRRYERDRPGELVHVDIKKLGRIPDGGGHKVLGRQAGTKNNDGHGPRRVGYGFIHSAVDDYSRLAYSEIHPDEKKETASAFWLRAAAWFADHGITVTEVLTDNGSCYRSHHFADALGDIKHRRTRPYRPQTNGKVERFNRTMLEEWAYVRPYMSEAERVAALDAWLHGYNHHRHHTAIGGPPIGRVNDLPGHYS
ncbi:MAG: family transposase [Acidimicrobiales bacterium]|nr:family transposase [Acidimicrobiales bacterium]